MTTLEEFKALNGPECEDGHKATAAFHFVSHAGQDLVVSGFRLCLICRRTLIHDGKRFVTFHENNCGCGSKHGG